MENNVITVRGLWLAVVLLTGSVAAVLAAAVFWLVKADPAAVFTAVSALDAHGSALRSQHLGRH
jgi:hypothetical protein